MTIVWWIGVDCNQHDRTDVWRQVVWFTVRWCQIAGRSDWQLRCDAGTGEQKGDLGLTSGAWQVCSESHRQMCHSCLMRTQPQSSEIALSYQTLGHVREDFTATWQSVGQNHQLQPTTFTIKTVWIVTVCGKFPFKRFNTSKSNYPKTSILVVYLCDLLRRVLSHTRNTPNILASESNGSKIISHLQ